MYVCNAFPMDPNLLTTNVLAHFSNISPGALFAFFYRIARCSKLFAFLLCFPRAENLGVTNSKHAFVRYALLNMIFSQCFSIRCGTMFEHAAESQNYCKWSSCLGKISSFPKLMLFKKVWIQPTLASIL